MTLILDGKKLSLDIRQEIKNEIISLKHSGKKIPHLAAVLVGNNGGSEAYIKSKVKACNETGMRSSLIRFDENISENILLNAIYKLNTDEDVDGFIVQLPLPPQINQQKIILSINPEKDVDGFHPENIGKIQLGLPAFISATPLGILTLLERYKIETATKHCVVIGRSNIAGTPISILLSRNANPGNCTVTLCHSKTKNITEFTRNADILVAATGKPEFITADMIQDGCVIIDVGITRVKANNEKGYVIKGDVNFDDVMAKCSAITPVPGGVGLMTVVSLLQNTLMAAKNKY